MLLWKQGVFESLNFAILKKLQVIFVCENNFYSVYSDKKYDSHRIEKFQKWQKG